MIKDTKEQEDWRERQWRLFKEHQRRANAEATVALSHEADCDCGTCKRVRRRKSAGTEA